MHGRAPVIGFAGELESFNEWLANPDADTTLVGISGIAGIGKTTLLMEIARGAEQASAVTLWLDGRGELSTSGAFLSSLEMTLASEHGRVRPADTPLLTFVAAELSRQRTVLLLDNGEQIDRMEGWFLSSFLPKLASSQVLLVIATRNGLPLKWRTNPYWGPRIRIFPLKPFTRQEVHAYLRNSGLAADAQAEIARETEGHPLLLALTVDWVRSNGEAAGRRIPSIVTAEILREAATPRLHRVLEAMSLLPTADPQLLNEMLGDLLDANDVHTLERLSFIHTAPHGWALHPLVSRLIRTDFAASSPERFRQLRRKAFILLAERFRVSDKKTQMRIAGHVLELYREYLPTTNEYAVFAGNVKTGEQLPFRLEDLPELQRLLTVSVEENNWQTELAATQEYPALLEDIAIHSPEGICVVRDEAGRPIAFSAGILLHEGTLPLLDRYTPGYRVLLGEEAESIRQLPPEAADTILVVLAAVDSSQRLYRPEEIGGVLMLQWLIMMTSGWRGVMVSADPHLNGLLTVFGFRNLGAAGGITMWEIDFRHIRFDDWVQTVIRQMDVGHELRTGGTVEQGLDESDLKRIMRHFYDESDVLEPYCGIGRQYRTTAVLRARIQAKLTEEPPSHPLSQMDQRILRESYLSKDRNKNQLADDLHMSRTTLYRHTQSALRHLAYVLNQGRGRS